MEYRRLLPYVGDKTLNEVVDRLRERETEYLIHITEKIRRDNPFLIPVECKDGREVLPIQFGVYELLDLSLHNGERLPVVSPKTIAEKLKQPLVIVIAPDGNLLNVNFREIEQDRNYNVKAFVDWVGEYKSEQSSPVSLILYSFLRGQAEKDEEDRIRRSN